MQIEKTIKKILNELSSSRYAGYYNGPLSMGEKDWDKNVMSPFTIKVSKYYNPDLQYDSYDGSLDSHKKNRKELEKAYNVSLNNNTALLKGVVSRKSQIVPVLTDLLSQA